MVAVVDFPTTYGFESSSGCGDGGHYDCHRLGDYSSGWGSILESQYKAGSSGGIICESFNVGEEMFITVADYCAGILLSLMDLDHQLPDQTSGATVLFHLG